MGKIKIHEIAKKLGLASKEVLEVANKLQIEVKNHLSGVSEDDAKRIEKEIGKNGEIPEDKETNKKQINKKEKKKEKQVKKDSKKEESAPVIIRREVIITQDEPEKKKQDKKEQKKNNVGFVERKQNKDYNIV